MASGASRPPLVSVVFPIRNEAGHIAASLDAVLAQDYPPDRMEVIVADGMSGDGTREIVLRYGARDPRVRLIDNPGRIVPTGLNAALRAAQGAVIVRVDGHTLIERSYVSEAVAALGRTGADVVGGNMSAAGRTAFGRAVALATSTPAGVGGSAFHYKEAEGPAESVYMGVFRRDVFERFGLFDAGLVRNQDDEFNYRVRERGGRICLVPSLRSTYAPRESPSKLFRQYFQYGLYKVRVALLHPRMMRSRHVVPAAFVLALASLAAASWFSSVALVVLGALLAAHALAALLFSARSAARDPAAWLLVPATTLILHVAYGSGFAAACVAALAGRTPGAEPARGGAS